MPILEQTESQIEQRCRTIAETARCKLLKIQAQRGWPDRMLLVPPGLAAFVEFKRASGAVRPLQEYRLQECRDMGFRAEVVRSVDQFRELMASLASSPRSGCRGDTKSGA